MARLVSRWVFPSNYKNIRACLRINASSCNLISKMIFSLQNVSPWNKLVSRLHWFRFREFLINYKRHYINLIPVKLREVSSYFLFIRDCFKGRYVQRNMIKIRNYSDATHDFGNFSDFSDWFENFYQNTRQRWLDF